jgi:gamma-glutamyltranspeptidase/glutathione hydrolase
MRSTRPPSVGKFMAVTANVHATDAALEILRLGGNALDAAIAAQWVLNLVEPQSSGIGGGGFLLHWDAVQKQVSAWDGRETAPRAASADFAQRADGSMAGYTELLATGKAVGVPGLVAMLDAAHRKHGKLRWERLFRPAIRLAENCFAVSPRLHLLLRDDPLLRRDPAARALYFRESGDPLQVGDNLCNMELAATLRIIATGGATLFIGGRVRSEWSPSSPIAAGRCGRRIFVTTGRKGASRYVAPIASGAFAACHPRRRAVSGFCRYSAYLTTAACPLPRPQRLMRPTTLPRPVGWPTPIVPATLPTRITSRFRSGPWSIPATCGNALVFWIQRRSMGIASPGVLPTNRAQADDDAPELPSTTHLSIVDQAGNAVALTSSIESAFGSRIQVDGYLLNNQLTDFSLTAERDGRPVANRLEPGKRPLSSMAPTFIFDAAGQLHAVLGSPGGSRIINYVARTIVSVLDGGLDPASAIAMPHVGNRNGATEIERGRFPEDVAQELERRGHELQRGDMTSGLNLIVRHASGWIGAADPRREGSAGGD